MRNFRFWLLLPLGVILSTLAGHQTANALPGQPVEAVAAWIAANPTLNPTVPGALRVERSNTAAQRFSFQATVVPPGRISFPPNRGVIRTEFFSFFDMINGVTPERLAETLRVIYGADIYQDFLSANVVYSYPTPDMIEMSRRQNLPLLEAQKGQLRLGNRYAYWVEVVETDTGKAYNGKMTVLLPEDLNKIQAELLSR